MLPPARDAPAAAGRDAGCHEPTVTRPSREQARDEQLPRPRTGPRRLAPAGASRSRHHRHGRRPAGGGMQRQPVIHRVRRLTDMREGQRTRVRRSPTPGACAPTGCRTSPTPTAAGRSLSKLSSRALRGVSDSRAEAATDACANLNPAGQGSPTLTAQEQQDYLRAAACMRSHGITGFPDPTFPGGRVNLSSPLQHRYQVKAVHPGRADLHKTHPGRTPLQQRVRWLKTMAGSKAGGGS